jgi:hypothetical protein
MTSSFRNSLRLALALVSVLTWLPAWAQPALSIKPLAEKRVDRLPEGTLSWRIENFQTVADAAAAATPWSLSVQAAGKVWLFTLGAKASTSDRASLVTEVGPIPRVSATEYLLRINEATGVPGSVTPVHSHPGSEAFYVLEGQQSIRGAHGILRIDAGKAEAGHGADQPMQVSSSGTSNLHALVMFVVDAKRPFSSPAALP